MESESDLFALENLSVACQDIFGPDLALSIGQLLENSRTIELAQKKYIQSVDCFKQACYLVATSTGVSTKKMRVVNW